MQLKIENIKRKDLLSLPVKKWDEEKIYDFLFLTSTGKKHDSGYSFIAVVGVRYGDIQGYYDAEIAATCDDINWSFPSKHPYQYLDGSLHNIIRTDCLWPSGIIRMWASGEHYFKGKFKVGASLSSTSVTLIIAPVGNGINKVTGEKIQ